jgi:chromosome segregation ATPase
VVSELKGTIEELQAGVESLEAKLAARIRAHRKERERAELAEVALAETRSELATRTEELRARSGELAEAEKLIVYLKDELAAQMKRLEGELAAQTTRAEGAEADHAREQAARVAAEAVIADQTAQLWQLQKEVVPSLEAKVARLELEVEEAVAAMVRAHSRSTPEYGTCLLQSPV